MNTDKIYAEAIANEYSVKTATKVTALKKLDQKVKTAPLAFTIVLGIISTLIFGTGMSFALGVLIGTGTAALAVGAVLGVVGIVGMSVNYPVYKKFLAKRKEQYAGEIISLAKEIADEQ